MPTTINQYLEHLTQFLTQETKKIRNHFEFLANYRNTSSWNKTTAFLSLFGNDYFLFVIAYVRTTYPDSGYCTVGHFTKTGRPRLTSTNLDRPRASLHDTLHNNHRPTNLETCLVSCARATVGLA